MNCFGPNYYAKNELTIYVEQEAVPIFWAYERAGSPAFTFNYSIIIIERLVLKVSVFNV